MSRASSSRSLIINSSASYNFACNLGSAYNLANYSYKLDSPANLDSYSCMLDRFANTVDSLAASYSQHDFC